MTDKPEFANDVDDETGDGPTGALGRELQAALEESFFWQPSERITFLPWETTDEPIYANGPARVLPKAGFPFHAMTEVEVEAFARGVARLAKNAWIASVKAFDGRDTDLEVFYGAQAERLETVLALLERVLRGEYPGPGAN